MPALDIITLSGEGGIPDARQIIDASIAASATALTSPSAPFSAGDVGKAIVVAGAGSAGAKLSTTIATFVSATEVTLAASAGTSVTNNGATWGTDCAAALQSALDTLANANGGTLVIDGQYFLGAGVSRNFGGVANGIRVIGTGSNSALYVCCPADQAALTIANAQQLSFESFYFIGTPDERVDALQVLNFQTCWVVIRECGFFGLASIESGAAAIILADRSYLTLEDNHIAGCTVNTSIASRSVIVNSNWGGFVSKRNRYIDLGTFNGIVHNKLAGLQTSPLAWVRLESVNNNEVQENALTHGVARFEDDRMDEFAIRCIVAQPAAGIIPHVLLDGVRFNVPMFNSPVGAALQAINVESLEVRRCFFGYVQSQQYAAILDGCTNVLFDRCRNNEFATGLSATNVSKIEFRDCPNFDWDQFNLTNVALIFDDQWRSWTPAITAASGSITSSSLILAIYRLVGDICHVILDFSITNNGTGSVAVNATLPFTACAIGCQVLPGRERASTGDTLMGQLTPTTNMMGIQTYNNSYPGANGRRLVLSGSYRIQS